MTQKVKKIHLQYRRPRFNIWIGKITLRKEWLPIPVFLPGDFQFSPVTQSCLTLCNPINCSIPGFLVHHQLLELAQTQAYWVSDAIQPSHTQSSPSPAFNFPSISDFSNESDLCIRWLKYGSFSFSISPSNEQSGLISFRIHLFGLLAVQGNLKGLLQHHSSKTSVLQCSAFFMVKCSLPYMTSGKTIALTRWAFVGKVMSLLFNMLSSLIIAFLPRSKHLLISWLQLPSVVILELQKESLSMFPLIPHLFAMKWRDRMTWS